MTPFVHSVRSFARRRRHEDIADPERLWEVENRSVNDRLRQGDHIRVQIEVNAHLGFQKILVVTPRLIAIDVGKADLDENCTDIGMLELDRTRRSTAQNGPEMAITFSLVERLLPELMFEHDEVVRDGRGNFFWGPVLSHA